jgi:hypothetical protein
MSALIAAAGGAARADEWWRLPNVIAHHLPMVSVWYNQYFGMPISTDYDDAIRLLNAGRTAEVLARFDKVAADSRPQVMITLAADAAWVAQLIRHCPLWLPPGPLQPIPSGLKRKPNASPKIVFP